MIISQLSLHLSIFPLKCVWVFANCNNSSLNFSPGFTEVIRKELLGVITLTQTFASVANWHFEIHTVPFTLIHYPLWNMLNEPQTWDWVWARRCVGNLDWNNKCVLSEMSKHGSLYWSLCRWMVSDSSHSPFWSADFRIFSQTQHLVYWNRTLVCFLTLYSLLRWEQQSHSAPTASEWGGFQVNSSKIDCMEKATQLQAVYQIWCVFWVSAFFVNMSC